MKTMSNKDSAGWAALAERTRTIALTALILFSVSGFACQSSEETEVNANGATAATPEKKVDDFQEILKSYETAGFKFIYVFRRFDGDVFSDEDRGFLRNNKPIEINRWSLTEDSKIVVAGSNYKFPPEIMETLKTRFAVEDYSKPQEESFGNRNSNVNQNSNAVKRPKTRGEK